MHPQRKKRLLAVLLILLGVSGATALTVWSLQQNMLFFLTPGDAQVQDMPVGQSFRLGGLVENGSVERANDGLAVRFKVTDGVGIMTVQFDGILPDLFQEGQGVIARGALNGEGLFLATEVLAKHDENYMPPEVAEALREKGHPAGSGT